METKRMEDYTVEELYEMMQEINYETGDLQDEAVYDMEQLDDLFIDTQPSEFAMMLSRDFNIHHDYFFFDGYGKIVSLDSYKLEKYLEMLRETIVEYYHEIKK